MPEKAAPAQWTTVVRPRKDDETGAGGKKQEGVADVGSWDSARRERRAEGSI
jgi:hypothetical protein